jgi:hypothetical protein
MDIRKIKMYSSTVNQNPSDVSCGYWCLKFLELMQKNSRDFAKTMAEISSISEEELSKMA